MTADPDLRPPGVAILADDLIWSTRLADIVRRAGGTPMSIRSATALDSALVGAAGCIVDLTASAYDGIAALRVAGRGGVPAVAVGQHDDVDLRRAAREAGATRVYSYRALFEHGDRELGAWIAGLGAAADEGAR